MATITGGKMSLNIKVRFLQLACHILSIVGIGYIVYSEAYYWIIVSVVSWLILGHICTIVTLHRLLTHRSFETYPWLERSLSFLSTYSTVGPTISWVALHRMHHANGDKIYDPHSPYVDGKFNLFQAFKVFIGYDWHIPNIPVKFVKDLLRDPIHKFIFDNYFKIIFITLFVLFLVNPLLILYVYCIPVTLLVISIGSVNVLGHGHGYRNHDTKDFSTNSWIVSLVTLGEGWHNNHHNKPTNYYVGEHWYEPDIMGLFIKLIKTDDK